MDPQWSIDSDDRWSNHQPVIAEEEAEEIACVEDGFTPQPSSKEVRSIVPDDAHQLATHVSIASDD